MYAPETDPRVLYLIVAGKPRNPGWEKVAKAHLKLDPVCNGCRTDQELQVHHVKPYHLFPELELVDSNLVTVCRSCHFVLCHDNNWTNYVKDARGVLRRHLRRVKSHQPERRRGRKDSIPEKVKREGRGQTKVHARPDDLHPAERHDRLRQRRPGRKQHDPRKRDGRDADPRP